MPQSPKHRARRKGSFKDEPIDVAELAGMRNVEGMLSFLDRTPQDYVRLFQAEQRAPVPSSDASEPPAVQLNIGAPDLTAPKLKIDATQPLRTEAASKFVINIVPEVSAPSVGAPDLIGSEHTDHALELEGPLGTTSQPARDPPPELSPPRPTAPAFTSGAPDLKIGAEQLAEDYYLYRPTRLSICPATTAQDGHTHGEQALYATLWRLAKPSSQGSYRIITIGERSLASQVPMSYSTVQENLRSLQNKLSLQTHLSGPRQPKTYQVFSYDEILKRRRAAGLTHIVRRTSGVFLVDPTRNIGAPTVGAPIFNDRAPAVHAPEQSFDAPNLRRTGAPNLGALLGTSLEERTTSTSKTWPLAIRALLEAMGHGDDDAVAKIAHDVLQNAPDATDEEIAQFIREEAPRVIRNRKLNNPMGMLIRQVPRRFAGEAFQMYRQAKREAEEFQVAQNLRFAHQILEDPCSPQEDRTWAESIIREHEQA